MSSSSSSCWRCTSCLVRRAVARTRHPLPPSHPLSSLHPMVCRRLKVLNPRWIRCWVFFWGLTSTHVPTSQQITNRCQRAPDTHFWVCAMFRADGRYTTRRSTLAHSGAHTRSARHGTGWKRNAPEYYCENVRVCVHNTNKLTTKPINWPSLICGWASRWLMMFGPLLMTIAFHIVLLHSTSQDRAQLL